jgi:hypothetical protein
MQKAEEIVDSIPISIVWHKTGQIANKNKIKVIP